MDTRNLSLQELVQTIRGQPGTTVRLQVQSADAPPGSPPRTVSIVRSQFQVKQ
jgi:C-terminal processing protease CtpA/Prc